MSHDILIISNDKLLTDYLRNSFDWIPNNCPVTSRAKRKDVIGKHVVGTVPVSLGLMASRATTVSFRRPSAHQEGPIDVKELVGEPTTYEIEKTSFQTDAEKIIVTRHQALIDYIHELDLAPKDAPVYEHIYQSQIKFILDTHIIGIAPFHRLKWADRVTHIPYRHPPKDYGNGRRELGLEELRRIAKKPETHKVQKQS